MYKYPALAHTIEIHYWAKFVQFVWPARHNNIDSTNSASSKSNPWKMMEVFFFSPPVTFGDTSAIEMVDFMFKSHRNQVHCTASHSVSFHIILVLTPLQLSVHLSPGFLGGGQRSSLSQIARRSRILIILLTVHLSNKTVGLRCPGHY